MYCTRYTLRPTRSLLRNVERAILTRNTFQKKKMGRYNAVNPLGRWKQTTRKTVVSYAKEKVL
jgi:hypothetical protein